MWRWWLKIRYTMRSVLFPVICVQFFRTLILPSPLDVFILFALFLMYVALLLNMF